MKNQRPTFKRALLHPRYWMTWLGLGFGWLLAQLPFTLQMQLGKMIGLIMRKASSRRVKIAETNLKLCFPDKSQDEIQKLINANFESVGIAVMETLISWWSSPSKLKSRVTIEGLEYLENAVKEKHGVILLGAHYTTLEIAGKLLAIFYTHFDALYRQHKNPVFDKVMNKRRKTKYKNVIEIGKMRKKLRSLKKKINKWYKQKKNNI